MGALGILLAYRFGRSLAGPVPALVSAAWLATCPIFLNQLVQPMSDVPAMTLCLAAIDLSLRTDDWTALLAGLALSAAVLVRPNLILLALPVGALLWLGPTGQRPGRGRLPLFCLGLAPGLALLGWTQATLYGSCLATGYGDARTLFRFTPTRLALNLGRHAGWLVLSNSVLVFAAPLALWMKERRGTMALVLACAAALAIPYLFYRPFDHWSYLRFFLPALPLLLVASWWAAAGLCDRLPPGLRLLPVLPLCAFLFAGGLGQARELGVFALRESECRYEEVGRYIARTLPERAVLLSRQQSGSLRLYSGRLTLRFDLLDPAWLDRSVAWLAARGFEPYLVLESDEELLFERRFAGRSALGRLDWSPVAVRLRPRRARIYRLADHTRARPVAPPDVIPSLGQLAH
jgi:hypothetical protein